MKRKLLMLFGMISCWIFSHAQAPDLIYYKFEDSSYVTNHATDPVGWLPATISDTALLDTGGFQGTHAFKGQGGSRTRDGVKTGWNTTIDGSFTFSFWYDSDPVINFSGSLLGDSTGLFAVNVVYNSDDNRLNYVVNGISGTWYTSQDTPHVFHFVYNDAVTKETPYGTYTTYLDGTLYNTGIVNNPINFTGMGLALGYDPKDSRRILPTMSGKMDEFRWYDRALTANEVANTWNIDVSPLGDCPSFTTFTMDSISGSGARVHWKPGTGNTSFFLEYGAAGFTPGTGTKITGNYPSDTSKVVLTGLNPETVYDIYFGETCPGGDSIYNRAPYSFVTGIPCSFPTGLEVINITPVSADVHWNYIGATDAFYLIYGPRGFDPQTSGEVDTVIGTTHTLNVDPGTRYDVYLVADCGSANGMSDTTERVLFKSSCDPVTASYLEDFEDASWIPRMFSSGNGYSKDTINACWTRSPSWIEMGLEEPESGHQWFVVEGNVGNITFPGNGTGPLSGQGGSGKYFITNDGDAGEEAILYTPFIDVSSLSKPYLSFYYHRKGVTQPDCYVEINDGNGWRRMIVMKGEHQLSRIDPYDSTGIDLSSFGDTLQVRFRTIVTIEGSYGQYNNRMALDNIEIKEGPPETCPEVQGIVNMGSGKDTTVTIDMIFDNLESGDKFNFEWGPPGFIQGTGCLGQGTAPYTMDSCISLNTFQEVYVQNNCQDSGLGLAPWSGPFSFCTPFTAPYANDFDYEESGSLPVCWTNYLKTSSGTGIDQMSAVRPYAGKAVSGQNVLELYRDGLNPGDTNMVFTPRFTDMGEGDKQIRFATRAFADPGSGAEESLPRKLIVGTVSSFVEGSEFSPLDTIELRADSWQEYTIKLNPLTTAYNGSDQIIAFKYITALYRYAFPYCLIDNFRYEEVSDCLPPDMINFTAGFIKDRKAEVSWEFRDAGSIAIEWGENGFSPGTGEESGSSITQDAFFTISGLDPSSNYDVYIRLDCGGSYSNWVGPLSFTTACPVISAPYFENFNGPEWSPSRCGCLANCGDSIGGCWSRIATCQSYGGNSHTNNSPHPTWGVNDAWSSVAQDHGGDGNFIFPVNLTGGRSGSEASNPYDSGYIYSPIIDISALNSPYLSLYYHRYGDLYADVRMDINDGSGWAELISFANRTQEQNSRSAPFRYLGTDISSFGDTIQVRFRSISTSMWGVDPTAIDDLRVDEAPPCSFPENLSAEDIMDTTTNSWQTVLKWEDPLQIATAYEIRFGPEGFANPGSHDPYYVDTATSISYIIDTLKPNTCYEFMVRSLCGSDTGIFEGPFVFCTPCEPEVAPYLHPFFPPPGVFNPIYGVQTFQRELGDCWRGKFTPFRYGGHKWEPEMGQDERLEQGVYGGAYAKLHASPSFREGDVATLTSPMVNIKNLTSPELSFYYLGPTYDTHDTVYVDIYDGIRWFEGVLEMTEENNDNLLWKDTVADLSPYNTTGFLQVRFRHVYTGGNNFSIDEFRIGDPETCPNPFNFRYEDSLNTEAMLRWSGDVADNYIIEYGPSGYTFGEGTDIIVSGDSTVIPVSDNRMYHAYIRSICGSGDTSDAVGPIQFNSKVIPCDDVEAYTPGPLDDQSVLFRPWDPAIEDERFTFGGNYLSSHEGNFNFRGDEEISDQQSVSGTQSLRLYEGTHGASGVFTNIEKVESGIHKVGFDIFLADTGGGVYEIPTYTKTRNVSAIFFFDGMSRSCNIYVYGNTTAAYSFPFTGSWNRIEHVIDLENDTTWMLVNDIDINIGWRYTHPYGLLEFSGIHFVTTPSNFNVSGAASDFYIDDFCLDEFECPAPSALVVDQSSCTQAVVSWMDGINGSATFMEYDTTGFTRGTGTTLNVEANRDTLTSLTPGGSYDVYVAEICGYDTVYTGPLTISLPSEAEADFTIDKGEPTASDLTVKFDGTISVAAMNYSWDFGDGNNSSDVAPVHVYTQNGTYQVQLIIESDCGNDTITKTVEIRGISIEENALSRSLQLYPNPTEGKVQLHFETQSSEDAILRLTDLSGKMVMERRISNINGRYQGEIDMSKLSKGSYMLRIESGDLHAVERVVKN